MKLYPKILIALFSATLFLQVACKKGETVAPKTSPTVDEAAMSKQIALSFYQSQPKTSNGLEVHSLKKTNQVTTMANGCGVPFFSTTNKSATSGDTSRTYKGNSIFTPMCNGYFNNGWNIDAYTLSDTLSTIETGPGFSNSYLVTLNYDVRTLDAGYRQLSIRGITYTSDNTIQQVKGGAGDAHVLATTYKLINIIALNGTNPTYVSGVVEFSTRRSDKDASTGGIAVPNSYSGFMEFFADHTIKSHFLQKDGNYKVYQIDLITGKVTPL